MDENNGHKHLHNICVNAFTNNLLGRLYKQLVGSPLQTTCWVAFTNNSLGRLYKQLVEKSYKLICFWSKISCISVIKHMR